MSVEKYRCNVDKKGQQSIVDTAIDTFIRKYRRYRYIKSIADNIEIDIDITNPANNDTFFSAQLLTKILFHFYISKSSLEL